MVVPEKPLLVIGVAGSSASYKVCQLIRLMRRHVEVRVVMTRAATEFIRPKLFHVLTGHPVLLDLFHDDESLHPHVTLSTALDLFLIAPATADFLGKIACGVATDALSTLAISVSPSRKPCYLAPTMMPLMFAHPAVQRNLATLESWGYRILGPASGRHADGLHGPGRMCEPDEIAAALRRTLRLNA